MADVVFGAPSRIRGGLITVPVNSITPIRYVSANAFNLTSHEDSVDPGDHDISDVFSVINRMDDMHYHLVLSIPPNRKGMMTINAGGNVILGSTGNSENLFGTTNVNFDTTVPEIINFDSPEVYVAGERFIVRFSFNAITSGMIPTNIPDFFIFEGASLGTPEGFKWIDADNEPDYSSPEPDPENLDVLKWAALETPVSDSSFDIHNANVTKHYLFRFPIVSEGVSGAWSMTLRDDVISGPRGL